MPMIYLSPSTQDWNLYVTKNGSEEYYMNLLADAMTPYLVSNGIQCKRNAPDMTAVSSIQQANSGWYDFYLALHTHASDDENSGKNCGVIVFYSPKNTEGKRAAEIFAKNLRKVYPQPDRVRICPTTTMDEVCQPHFPAVLIELGYHDNYADAVWVENDMDEIAQNLVLSLTEYLGLPFIWPMKVCQGTITVPGGTLNLRNYPSGTGTIIARMPGGDSVQVCGEWQGWYVVHYGIYVGYAAAVYIQLA